MAPIDKNLVEQRIRNRVCEVLEIAASFDAIAKFGMFEAINLWDDFVQPYLKETYKAPTYSAAEQTALWKVQAKWERAADATHNDSWSVSEISKIPEWIALQKAANETLSIFEKRGRFSEGVIEKM